MHQKINMLYILVFFTFTWTGSCPFPVLNPYPAAALERFLASIYLGLSASAGTGLTARA